MRRSFVLLAVPAAAFLLPAPSASAACTSSSGVTVCPPVYTCGNGSIVTVQVVGGIGRGTASCDGASATCTVIRALCTASDNATSSGVLSCSSTGNVVAICTVSPSPR